MQSWCLLWLLVALAASRLVVHHSSSFRALSPALIEVAKEDDDEVEEAKPPQQRCEKENCECTIKTLSKHIAKNKYEYTIEDESKATIAKKLNCRVTSIVWDSALKLNGMQVQEESVILQLKENSYIPAR